MKLKDCNKVLDEVKKFLDAKEATDIKSILLKNKKYADVFYIKRYITSAQDLILNEHFNSGNLPKDFLKDKLDIIDTNLAAIADGDEVLDSKKKITEYKKSKLAILKKYADEDVEIIKGYTSYYAKYAITVVNLPNINIGRLCDFSMTTTKGTSYNSNIGLYICNTIIPSFFDSNGNEIKFVCNGDFLYKNNVWNTSCKNFLIDKFNAKQTMKGILHSTTYSASKLSGRKPEWLENLEILI